MKTGHPFSLPVLILLVGFASLPPIVSRANELQPRPAAGPESVIVQSEFGGQIFGFDIDQAGNEGVLSEAQTLDNGAVMSAVETFSQKTGEIIKVVVQGKRRDDFVTPGVVGDSVG